MKDFTTSFRPFKQIGLECLTIGVQQGVHYKRGRSITDKGGLNETSHFKNKGETQFVLRTSVGSCETQECYNSGRNLPNTERRKI